MLRSKQPEGKGLSFTLIVWCGCLAGAAAKLLWMSGSGAALYIRYRPSGGRSDKSRRAAPACQWPGPVGTMSQAPCRVAPISSTQAANMVRR
jgi:hypothetical protein